MLPIQTVSNFREEETFCSPKNNLRHKFQPTEFNNKPSDDNKEEGIRKNNFRRMGKVVRDYL